MGERQTSSNPRMSSQNNTYLPIVMDGKNVSIFAHFGCAKAAFKSKGKNVKSVTRLLSHIDIRVANSVGKFLEIWGLEHMEGDCGGEAPQWGKISIESTS